MPINNKIIKQESAGALTTPGIFHMGFIVNAITYITEVDEGH